MLTVITPFESSALEMPIGIEKVPFTSFKELKFIDDTTQSCSILMADFRNERLFNEWKRIIAERCDVLIKSQDENELFTFETRYLFEIASMLQENNHIINSDYGLVQVPLNKLDCLEYFRSLNSGTYDLGKLLAFFNVTDVEQIMPNFYLDSDLQPINNFTATQEKDIIDTIISLIEAGRKKGFVKIDDFFAYARQVFKNTRIEMFEMDNENGNWDLHIQKFHQIDENWYLFKEKVIIALTDIGCEVNDTLQFSCSEFLKLKLSLIPNMELIEGELEPLINFLGMPKFWNLNEVWITIQQDFKNLPSDEFYPALEELASNKLMYAAILKIFQNESNSEVRNEFISTFCAATEKVESVQTPDDRTWIETVSFSDSLLQDQFKTFELDYSERNNNYNSSTKKNKQNTENKVLTVESSSIAKPQGRSIAKIVNYFLGLTLCFILFWIFFIRLLSSTGKSVAIILFIVCVLFVRIRK